MVRFIVDRGPIMLTAFACVALAVYHEARSEPIEGQIAVAQVIMNRVTDDRYPDTPCDVVFQYKQFSFYWDGKSDTPFNETAWAEAERAANLVMFDGLYLPVLEGIVHYHGDYVTPSWAQQMAVVYTVGRHVFVL